MVIALIAVAAFACLITGYATRQRQELRETDAGIRAVLGENTNRIETLLVENANLRRDIKAYEDNLEMVLEEVVRLS